MTTGRINQVTVVKKEETPANTNWQAPPLLAQQKIKNTSFKKPVNSFSCLQIKSSELLSVRYPQSSFVVEKQPRQSLGLTTFPTCSFFTVKLVEQRIHDSQHPHTRINHSKQSELTQRVKQTPKKGINRNYAICWYRNQSLRVATDNARCRNKRAPTKGALLAAGLQICSKGQSMHVTCINTDYFRTAGYPSHEDKETVKHHVSGAD